MTNSLHFTTIILAPFALFAAALYFGRARIHRQMEEIAEAARTGALKRTVPFRPLRSLPRASG